MSAEERSFDIRIWEMDARKGARRTTYRVRWAVAGKRFTQTFQTRKLGESFRANLVSASRSGEAFGTTSGRPQSLIPSSAGTSWLDFASQYAAAKWPHASPRHRKGIAEALTGITVALLSEVPGAPDGRTLRTALTYQAFGRPQEQGPDSEAPEALHWARRASPEVAVLAQPSELRRVVRALSSKLDGSPAAPATTTRKRATLNNVLLYAVEEGHLSTNPLPGLKDAVAPRSFSSGVVDRRVVVNPAQARSLLAEIRQKDPALAGFFGCLYFAAFRPAESRNVRRSDLRLPTSGWGRALLTGSHQISGRDWTDSGEAGEERSLKHRPTADTREVPLHPELVSLLRWHLDTWGVGADGRLFVTRTGRAGIPISPPYLRPVSPKSVYRAFHQARERAFTPAQAASPLARRPYDLRHAAVSTWLNSGVPAPQVAEWAGHSTDVLLRVYAKCIDGQERSLLHRIEDGMSSDDAPER